MVTAKKNSATLSFDDQSVEMPIYFPTLGESVIDVKTLGKYHHYTFDPGFYATASCESKITYIDGDKGVLLYRGYSIDQLADKCDYIQVCYLLLYGELPTATQKTDFENKIKEASTACDFTKKIFLGFPQDAHPMGILLGVIGSLSTRKGNACDLKKPEDRERAAIRLIAKVPLISAMAFRHNEGRDFIPADPKLGFVENFLHMLFGDEEKAKNPVLIQALEI